MELGAGDVDERLRVEGDAGGVRMRWSTLPTDSSGLLISWAMEAEMRPATASFSAATNEVSACSFCCWVVESVATRGLNVSVSAGAVRRNKIAVGTEAAAHTTFDRRGQRIDRPPDSRRSP